jgi:hypothetical protein
MSSVLVNMVLYVKKMTIHSTVLNVEDLEYTVDYFFPPYFV